MLKRKCDKNVYNPINGNNFYWLPGIYARLLVTLIFKNILGYIVEKVEINGVCPGLSRICFQLLNGYKCKGSAENQG